MIREGAKTPEGSQKGALSSLNVKIESGTKPKGAEDNTGSVKVEEKKVL